jgi:helicase
LATFNAIVLFERSMGHSVVDLERQYGIVNLEGVEERWRDTMIWLLAGIAQVLDIKSFYFHLKEECGADQERVKAVKQLLASMRMQALELVEQVKYASPLGGLVLAMRRRNGKAGVGVESIRKLEHAGVTQLAQIARLSPMELREFGLRGDVAQRIAAHLKLAAA